MKFCKDCRHYNPNISVLGDVAACTARPAPELSIHPIDEGRNFITGEPLYFNVSYARLTETMCGMEAKWFEPKEPNV